MGMPARALAFATRLDAAFVLVLLAVYALAAVCPAPGPLVSPALGVRTAQVVLAVLLFVAGLRTAVPADLREVVRRAALVAAGVAGRIVPLAAMLACLALVPGGPGQSLAGDIALGLTLVAAMPAANTSTAWTRRSSGDLTVCAGIIVATTLLSPVVIPATLVLARGPAGTPAASTCAFLDLAVGVIAWVVVPIAAGILVGRTGGMVAGKPLGVGGSLGTLGALVLLNYLNASQALPNVLDRGGPAAFGWAACGAAALVPLCYAAGAAAGRVARASPAQGAALFYAVGMGNTGLAGTLAAALFPGRPATLYPIVLCTLLQPVVAALGHQRRRG
ncbi:MAG: bile acid:sodium symporter [Planctomycetaceae bacterium]